MTKNWLSSARSKAPAAPSAPAAEAKTKVEGKTGPKPAPKRIKKTRNPPKGGWASEFIQGTQKQRRIGKPRHAAVAIQLATRGDLGVLELRAALYLTFFADFDKYKRISMATLAKDLGTNSTHVATAVKQLALKKIVTRERTEEPYGYKLKPAKKFKS